MFPNTTAFSSIIEKNVISNTDHSFILAKGGSSGGSRGGGFSSGRSSGGGWGSKSSSSPKSSPSKSSSGWGSKSAPAAKPAAPKAPSQKAIAAQEVTKGGALNGKRTPTKMTSTEKKADQAAYKAATTNGTAFKTRAEAVETFKKTADTKYPSTFASQPAARPSYIPEKQSIGGKDVTISYNQAGGGYGYMDPITNLFILYSVASMASNDHQDKLMTQQGYYVGEPVPYKSPVLAIFIVFIAVCVVVGLLWCFWDKTKIG